jgi:hypothetical protein
MRRRRRGNWVSIGNSGHPVQPVQTLRLSINRLDKRQAENQQQLQQHMSELRSYTATQFKQVHTNINLFAEYPTRRLGPTRPGASDVSICHTLNNTYDSTTKLSSCPNNLLLLWQEYLYGLEGNKAAKKITSVERGHANFKFCRRKCFWEVMVKICNAGFTDLSSIWQSASGLRHESFSFPHIGHDAERQEGCWPSKPVPITTNYIIIH